MLLLAPRVRPSATVPKRLSGRLATMSVLACQPLVWRSEGTIVEALLVPENDGVGIEKFCEGPTFIPFLRAVIATAEEQLSLHDYHLRLVKWGPSSLAPATHFGLVGSLKRTEEEALARAGWYALLAGDRCNTREAPRAPALERMDQPIEYQDGAGIKVTLRLCQRDICIVEGTTARVFLDAQGRPMYVSCLKRFVRRQSELTDVELAELWRLPVRRAATLPSGMVDARLNAGSFQNVAHLHLKVWVREDEFQRALVGHPGWEALAAAADERRR